LALESDKVELFHLYFMCFLLYFATFRHSYFKNTVLERCTGMVWLPVYGAFMVPDEANWLWRNPLHGSSCKSKTGDNPAKTVRFMADLHLAILGRMDEVTFCVQITKCTNKAELNDSW